MPQGHFVKNGRDREARYFGKLGELTPGESPLSEESSSYQKKKKSKLSMLFWPTRVMQLRLATGANEISCHLEERVFPKSLGDERGRDGRVSPKKTLMLYVCLDGMVSNFSLIGLVFREQ